MICFDMWLKGRAFENYIYEIVNKISLKSLEMRQNVVKNWTDELFK